MTHSQRNAGLIFFAAVIGRLVFHWVTGFVADDAFITFRYAENIAAGLGFVYNEGQRVMGTSTPLFTLILSVFVVLKLGAVYGALLVSLISSGVTAALLYRLAERLRFGRLWAIPVVLYILWPRAIIAETSGMEVAFYTMLVMASFYYSFIRRPYYALAAATLATVTRPEGVLVLGLVLLVSLRNYGWRWLSLLVVPALILVPWLLFADWYFGSPIPHTIPAQLALYSQTGAGTPWERLSNVLGFGQMYGWALVAMALSGIFWLWTRQRFGVIEFLWLAGTVAFYTVGQTKIFYWYVTPLVPMYLLFAMAGLVYLFDLVDWLDEREGNLVPLMSIVVFLGLGSVNVFNMSTYRQEQIRVVDTHEAIGYYLRTHTDEDAVVAAEDIGYIGSYSKRRILDRDGLVSPQAVPYNAAGRYGQLIYDFQPDVVVASTASPISNFIADTLFTAQYEMRRSYTFAPANQYLIFYRRATVQEAASR